MKILFYRYNSICEPDMIEAFESFGVAVVEEATEITDKSLTHEERISLLKKRFDSSEDEPFLFVFSFNFFPAISDLCQIYQIPYVCWSVDSPLAEIYARSICNSCNRLFLFDRQQYETLRGFNPDCIFHLPLCTNTKRWDSVIQTICAEDIVRCQGDISFIGSLYTEKDPWLRMAGPSSAENGSDTGLSRQSVLSPRTQGFADGLVAAQKSLVGCNILEQALPKDIAKEIVSAYPGRFADDSASVMPMDNYVAAQHILGMHASSLFRIEALAKLAEHFSVDLYTRSPIPNGLSSSDLPNASEPGLRLHGGVKTLTEMPKIFHLSKINLNLTIYPIQSGLSLRIWDVLGCGGFLLTNTQAEITDYFTPGEDLDTFSCQDELIEKCSFYLSHEDIRKKIALSGYRKVSEKHTWKHRFPEMMRCISGLIG